MLQRLSFITLALFCACSNEPSITDLQNPASSNSKFPRLFTDNSGSVFMSWYETEETFTLLKYSKLDGKTWSTPELISSSDTWFINWADFSNFVAADGKPIASHTLSKRPDNKYSYDVQLIGLQSKNTKLAHSDGTPTEHGFVSLQATSDSTFYAVWLDGRNTGNSHGHDDHVGNLDAAMTIRGAEFNLNLDILSEAEIDNSTCDCCNTALTTIPGGLIVAYRNRTADEIRDIYVSRFVDGSWSEGTPVFDDNWNIAACPVNGPALSSFNETVALSWFTGAENAPQTKLAFSTDSGLNFSEPILLAGDQVIGRVDVQMIDENKAWVSYLDRGENSAQLVIKKINTKGEVLDERIIPGIDPSRSTGFPQITKKGDAILVAWTDISLENPTVRTAIIL